jgi:hypothetical protein
MHFGLFFSCMSDCEIKVLSALSFERVECLFVSCDYQRWCGSLDAGAVRASDSSNSTTF